MFFRKKAVMTLAILTLVGCSNQGQAKEPQSKADKSYDYTVDENEDVISKLGEVRNSEKLDAFISAATDQVRVVHYTKEGNPIFYNLFRMDNQIEVGYDTSQDKYGTSSVKTYLCDSLQKEEAGHVVAYKLIGCGKANKSVELLDVPM